MSRGRHRRTPISHLISRHISRVSVVLVAGSAGVAAPLLFAGQAAAAPAPAQAAQVAQAAPAQQAGQAGQDAGAYTVVRGDTLHRIATDHEVEGGWKALYEANRATVGGNPHLILPGQKLTLDLRAEAPAAPEAGKPLAAEKTAAEAPAPAAAQAYPDNLDGWIREALSIMQAKGIPGSYEGIHRNIIRESGGDPNAINNWDINAQNGTPSIGLLQVIKPTFDAYHVEGTANSQYDPVANIVAACNYAADRYGSIDNVNGPY
ncbi:LysM peptidoglycan-binding domain-containing protein [Streptomyces zingiberis]|uniref:Transglycosylase SLT domain-containing protein n=1 Tax=Streptomyces zingiberis TaxID=2053010 RepID=A0ABX1C0M9_9ACTN|nr:transglycosylase SLT domain-containing protein [Streptomyces zingiberis]NJQ03466.1 transglycosylase SLT domain-containing protein [Streptomyces zingiberis]